MITRRDLLRAMAIAPFVPFVPIVGCAPAPKTPLAHLYGQDWVHGAYELYAKGYQGVQTTAETQSFASYATLAQKGVVALDGLQSRGVPFFVRVDPKAQGFTLQRDMPERLTFTASMSDKDREQATADWTRAREHVQTDYEEIRRLNGALTTLLSQLQRVRNAIEEGKLEQYKLVRQLAPLSEGQTPFKLPYQVAAADYEKVLYLLLERLEDDRARLGAIESSIVTVGLTARATDANSGSLSANLRKVLLAVSDDATATSPRDAAYPAAPDHRDELQSRGQAIAATIRATDEYETWRKHEESKAFDQIGSLLATLDQLTGLPTSAIYQQALDIWRGDADYLSYLRMVAKFVPGGSKVAAVLTDAVGKTERARDALSSFDTMDASSIAMAGKRKGAGLINTGSDYAMTRAKKQLVFFGSQKEATDVEEALRATKLGGLSSLRFVER